MVSQDELLSDALKGHSGPLQRIKRPFLGKLHLFLTIAVFLSGSIVILVILFLQTQDSSLLDGSLSNVLQHKSSQIIYYNLIWITLVSCLASMGMFFLSKKMVTSITKLYQTTENISHGDFGAHVPVSSDDEIGLLTQTINKMSTKLHELQGNKEELENQLEPEVQARTKGLQEVNDRLENILNTSSQGFWRVDNDMKTLEINPRMAEILNCRQEDVIGKSIMGYVGIPNRTILHKQIHLGKSLLSTEYEIELEQVGGTFVPCLFNATPLLDDEGNKLGSFVMVTDIAVLKQTEKKLQEAISMAENVSQVKSSFLANMSHEIRTPLNGIIGSLELLSNEQLDVHKQKQFMKTAQQSADFLLMLLNDILDLSKIEADKIDLERVSFRPEMLLNHLQSMFVTQAKQKGLHLSLTAHTTVPEVLKGDKIRLTQICTNLLSNAIKFTKEGEVSLSLMCESENNSQLLLLGCVSDTGIGLSEDQQNIIFDSFSQADVSTTREFGGTGLGLALCKKLCSLMKGKIWVESIKDEGSSFYFRMPIEAGEISQLIEDDRISSAGHIEGRSMRPLDILVVDDNNVNRDVAEMFLTNDGHRVKTATNGIEALRMLSRHHFDCVFMDIQMPKIDGVLATRLIRGCEQKTAPPSKQYEQPLLKKLHAKVRDTHTPIIALTANVFQSDIKKYLAAGMDDHLGKPIKSKDMYQALLRATEHIEYEESDNRDVISLKEITLSEIERHLKDRYSFDSSQITTLIETSIISIREGLDLLDQTCLAENIEELGSAAHKLKGTLENLGLSQATELVKKIEFSAKEGENKPYNQWVGDLRRDLEPIIFPDSTSD